MFCVLVYNRDLSVLRLTELRVEESVMALDEDGFLPAAFRKVQKIGKGLRSNETRNIAGFLKRNRFTRLG